VRTKLRAELSRNVRTLTAGETMPESMDATHATAHVGPKGGTEYRLWTERVVGRYAAWPYMSDAERENAAALEATRKESKGRASANTQAWREIMRGGR